MLKINKTCDQCRHRKIRCIVATTVPGKPPVCVYCEKRNEPCHFSIFRRRATAKVARSFPEVASLPLKVGTGELLIDRILEQGFQAVPDVPPEDPGYVIKAPQREEQTPCAPLAFFSDQRVSSLCEKIGSYRLQSVVERLEEVIMSRIRATQDSPWAPIAFTKSSPMPKYSAEESRQYIEAYFKNLHPVYPFLDRQEFEQKAFGTDLTVMIENNPPFSALYHTVLALGAQYFHGAPYEPGTSKAWELFEISLGYMNELLLPGQNLEHVQALVAIAIFCQNMGCLQLDDGMIWQAARAAFATRCCRPDADAKTARTFWVIYTMEKQLCLEGHIGSTIADEDVGCVIPTTPESVFGNFNWFVSSIRCARITSVAYPTLFSVSASLGDVESRLSALANIRRRIEEWRMWVPAEFRPGEVPHVSNFPSHASKLALLQSHFWYYNIIITLERLTLKLDKNGGARCQQSRQNLMHVARSIADMTRFIELGSHVPLFILAVTPLSALFILFDFVIHNPRHHETRSNLSALDSITGYFSLLECASNGALFPAGTMIAEFGEIAREYYCKMQQTASTGSLARPARTRAAESAGDSASQDGEGTDHISASKGIDDATASSGTPSEGGTSDYLVYPTPHNFGAATDIQMYDFAGFNKSLFGWMVPDWAEGNFDLGAMNLDSGGGGSDVLDFNGNPTQ